jgi:hypothetical protein
MPLHEVDVFGLLLSPIFMMILVAIIATSMVAAVIDRVISYSLHRNESLIYVLLLVGLVALMASYTF